MVAHRAGVGEQPVERDECRNAGKQRQQGIEGDAGRDRQHPVLADLRVDPPEDVLPAFGRDLARGLGGAAAIVLGRGSLLGFRALQGQRVLLGSGPRALAGLVDAAAPIRACARPCRLAGGRSCRARERFRAAASRDSTSPIRSVERLVFDPLRAVRCEPAVATAMTGPCVTRTEAGARKSAPVVTITEGRRPMFPRAAG